MKIIGYHRGDVKVLKVAHKFGVGTIPYQLPLSKLCAFVPCIVFHIRDTMLLNNNLCLTYDSLLSQSSIIKQVSSQTT